MEEAMKKKSHFYYFQPILMVILLIFILPQCGQKEAATANKEKISDVDSADEIRLSQEVKKVLDQKKDLLLRFTGSIGLVPLVKKLDEQNRAITLDEIMKRDKKWQKAEGMDRLIKSFMTNECAQAIFNFQQQHDEFTEIFITDSRGALIGITNRTSDYYQADEAWWQKTYNGGKGLVYFGEIEYDESSKTEAIGLFVPILNPQSKKVMGVMKAVLSIAALKAEL
jgi:hypothetical protein